MTYSIEIETQRLLLRPTGLAEMEALRDAEPDPALRLCTGRRRDGRPDVTPGRGKGEKMKIVFLRNQPELAPQAAEWFHDKWHIPLKAYQESIADCIQGTAQGAAVPQWYLAMEGETIVGGMGVIGNDFHPRTDLTPNVCAVYVEPEHRCQGIARALLDAVCTDMASFGIPTLYLVTSHTSLYERYGWEYFCPVVCDGEKKPSRIYIHRQEA